MSLRERARAAAESILVASRIPLAMRAKRRGDTLILAYHNIVPEGSHPAGDRSLHLSQRVFAAQLDLLAATHDIVSLESAIAGPIGKAMKPRAVLTFDDAYRGAMTAGMEEISARSLPATIFVAPAFVDGGTFWWDALALPASNGIDSGFRSRALLGLRGMDSVVRERASEEGLFSQPLPRHAHCASEEELKSTAAYPGITLGSHSWSHSNLALLDGAALATELERPLLWLRQRFKNVTNVLSYPYGLSTTVTERAAEAAGYSAALRISGGWLRGRAGNRYALPRLNVPAGVSLRGFLLRASGVLGG